MRTRALGTLTLGLVVQAKTFRVGLAGKVAQVDVTAKISPATAAPEMQKVLGQQLAVLKRYAEYLAGGGDPNSYKKESDV